jgi:hypothetical protein
MASLTPDVQSFVVQQLAWYRTPTQVAEDVQEEFGVEVTRHQVQYYHPEKGGREPKQEWCEQFYDLREAIREGRVDVAIGQEAWRLQQLMLIYRKLMHMGHYLGAAGMLEQAAKDEGGKYTNRMEHSGPGGAPIEHSHDIDLSKLTDQQIERLAAGEPPEDVL